MSTNVVWNGTTYSIPAAGEVNWGALSNFLIALGNGAAVAEEMKQAIRVATTSPVTVSDTTDCVVMSKLAVAGAVAVTLPAGTNGRWFVVGDQTGDAATNNITITPNGAETINGSATYVIAENNGCVVLAYSSTNTRWNVLARFSAGSFLTNPMATTGDMIYGGGSGVATKLATGSTTGLLHGGNGAVPTWSLVVNADVSGSAAIDGSKIVSASGSVAGVVTTGTQTLAGAKTFTSGVLVDGSANEVQLTVQGNGTQTAKVFVVENSAGTDVFTVSNDGGTIASGGIVANDGYSTSESLTNSASIIYRTSATTLSTTAPVISINKLNCATNTNSHRLIQGAATTSASGAAAIGYIRTNAGSTNLEFEAASDRRIKRDTRPLSGLAIIGALNPVSYVRKDTGKAWHGFIAQEVAEVLPCAVTKTDDGTGDELPEGVEPWTMSEQPLVPFLVAAVKELKAEIEELKKSREKLA